MFTAHIGNIAEAATEDDLLAAIAKVCAAAPAPTPLCAESALHVRFVTEEDGQPRGFGFATFGSHEELDAFIPAFNTAMAPMVASVSKPQTKKKAEKKVAGEVVYKGRAHEKMKRATGQGKAKHTPTVSALRPPGTGHLADSLRK